MAPKASLPPLKQLAIAFLLLLCATTLLASADHSFDIDPNPSPEASTSLICPNLNPSDCYPTLFQPTIHFQRIRPNQSLPPGLHVRLNLQTGEKEARLNVPEENEGDKEAVVVADDVPTMAETAVANTEKVEALVQLRLQDPPKQAKHARPYTPPRLVAFVDPNENVLYEDAVSILKQGPLASKSGGIVSNDDTTNALETLTELAHSIEWGVAICRDADLSRSLLATITREHHQVNSDPDIHSAVLLLMATAIQNNPDAVNALLEHDPDENGFQQTLQPALSSLVLVDGWEGSDPNIVARAVFFLSQLCVNDSVMQAFASSAVKGLSRLSEIFIALPSNADLGQRKIRQRIVNFIEDHAEQVAVIYLGDEQKTNEIETSEIVISLRRWCEVFTSAAERFNKDALAGVLEAKREIERILEMYVGEGCRGSHDPDEAKEL